MSGNVPVERHLRLPSTSSPYKSLLYLELYVRNFIVKLYSLQLPPPIWEVKVGVADENGYPTFYSTSGHTIGFSCTV